MSKRSTFTESDSEYTEMAESSRSAQKRAAQEVRRLIGQIADLGEQSFNALEMPDDVRAALEAARSMSRRSDERRRQLQYAAKLQRAYPEFDLKGKYEHLSASIKTDPQAQRLERLRDELIEGGTATLNAFCALVRDTDRNRLRTLIKKAQRESIDAAASCLPRPCARELYRFVKAELARSGSELPEDFFVRGAREPYSQS